MKYLVLGFLIGCGSPATPKPVTPLPAAVADDVTCPLVVPGTSISAEDSPEGPSLVFVTTGDVATVRTRGQALAEMHNSRTGPTEDLGMMFTAGSTASAADVEGGVRVTFAGGKLDELQMHVKHLTGATSCVMH